MRDCPAAAGLDPGRRACREPRVYAAAVGLMLRPGERRQALEELFARTAAAFDCPVPDSRARGPAGRLREYALFTRDRAREALGSGRDLDDTRDRLYRAGHSLGARYRVRLAVRTPAGAMTAARLIYRSLGVDFHGFPNGEVLITRCSFARVYSADICALVSSLDRGLLAGLSSGGSLRFHQRITEGARSCRAVLEGVMT